MTSIKLSGSAIASAEAVMSSPQKERTEAERRYDEEVANCVPKMIPHRRSDENMSRCAKPLFAITTIASSPRYGGTRTVALCDNLERASDIVERNMGDIFEYSYELVVIEVITRNCVYGSNMDESYWYRWNHDKQCYEPIEIPNGYKNVCGIGIG